ncbi:BTAD domain-containing putative transcriptional regulator [Nocardia sp. NPDC049149]|uniref:BTAD domain-containing putative transcriptional regulator n=1 Tax=Nocardia sp. NPDC049149 TaxID=3364315 RepID=UPI0037117DFD
MAQLSFGVLGPLRAERAGSTLALKGPRHRAVLARLLVARGHVVSVDQLIGDLWEQPPRGAVGAIQTFVADLRRALEPERQARTPAEILVTAAPGYALRTAPDAVDADRFAAAVRHTTELLAAGQPDGALSTIDAALDLWQGPAYAEFAEQGWARGEVDRLDNLQQLAVEQRAAALVELARPAEAISGLEALVAEHPLREHAWQLLAVAMYRSGRQSDALAALRRIRELLRTELGADPGPELRQVEADILAQAPHLLPTTKTTRTAVRGTGFVGRSSELAALHRAADHVVRHGHAQLVLLTGEAGAGKTALAEELSTALAADGWITARGESPADLGVPPGWPWNRIVAALTAAGVASPPANPAGAPPLADTPAPAGAPLPADTSISVDAPPLADTPSPTDAPSPTGALTPDTPASMDPAEARFLFHRNAAEQLAAVARRAPVLLVFDDVHNAGAETLDLLTALIVGGIAGPVLVLATYRSTEIGGELTAALGKMARTEPVRVYLTGLSEADTDALVRAIAGPDLAAAAAAGIHQRSNGNPFFVRELSRLLRDEGAAALDTIPAGVREVIRHRLALLPQPAQTVVAQASVLGEDVDREILFELADDAERTMDSLETSLAAGLFTERPDGTLHFTHTLVRDTVYRDISGPRRAQWHGQIAALLERTGTAEVSVLAHHFTRAHSRATAAAAARYARAAALDAEQKFAIAEAARQWRAALDAFDRMPEPDLSAQLEATTGLARALAVTGGLAEARHYRGLAVIRAERQGDPTLTARVISAFDIPGVWTTNDDPELAGRLVAAAERTIAVLPADHRELRARLCTTVAMELRGAADDRGLHAAAEAETIARGLGDPALLAFALNGRFMHTFQRAGLSADRARIGAELIALGQQHRLPTFAVLGHLIGIQTDCATGALPAAAANATAADRLGAEYELPMVGIFTRWFSALRTAITGAHDEAAAAYRSAATGLAGSGMPGVEHGLLPLALLCLRLRHGLALRDDFATAAWGPHEPWVRPILLLDKGLRDEATVALRATPESPRDLLLELRTCLTARAAEALGDEPLMRRCYDQLLPAAQELAGAGTGLLTLDPVATYLAELATALGDSAAAARHRRQADTLIRRAR